MIARTVLSSGSRSVGSRLSFIGRRQGFSSIEEIKEAEQKIERHKMHLQKSALPKTMTDVVGSGVELYVPEDITEIASLTGMPKEHQGRTVIIAPRPLKTLSSGDAQGYQWQLTWKHSQRWNNPLMGWSSTADPQAQVKLNFDSEEDAVAYAKRNGWKFETRNRHAEANENIEVGTMTYSHNFLTARVEATVKAHGKKTVEYTHSGKHASNWFQPLNYDGSGETRQHGPKATNKA
jgi:hypothetical protein